MRQHRRRSATGPGRPAARPRVRGRSWCSHETTCCQFYLVVLSTLKLFGPQTIRATKELLGGTRDRWAPIGGDSPPLARIWRNLGAPAVHAALSRHGPQGGIQLLPPPTRWSAARQSVHLSGGTQEQPTEGNRGPPVRHHPLRLVPALRQVPNPYHLGTYPLPTGTPTSHFRTTSPTGYYLPIGTHSEVLAGRAGGPQ